MNLRLSRRLVPAAGLLMVLFFGSLEDAAAAINENGTESVYRIGQAVQHGRHAHARHVRRHHDKKGKKGKTEVTYNGGTAVTVTDTDPIAVPDGGSTLAMMAASTALLLLGYHRLGRKRIAA